MKTILIFLTLIVPQILFSQIVESEINIKDILDALKKEKIKIDKVNLHLNTTKFNYYLTIEEYKNDSLVWVDKWIDSSYYYVLSEYENPFSDTTEFRFTNRQEVDSVFQIELTINKWNSTTMGLIIDTDMNYFFRVQTRDSAFTDEKTPIAILSKGIKQKMNGYDVVRECLLGGAENLKSLSPHLYVFYLEKIPKVKN